MELEYSNSKALYHTEKIKALQEGRMIVPTEIQVDLEAYCNDNCSFCSFRKEDAYNNTMLNLIDAKPGEVYHENKPIGKPSPNSRIPDYFAEELPKQMVEAGIPAIEITGGGEPTLWPKLNELIENLGKAKRDIGLVTNGSGLTDKRIELINRYVTWLRISLDGATPVTHKLIHRTSNLDFQRRIEKLKKICDIKRKDLVIGISFIVTPSNIDEVDLAAKMFSDMKGIDHLRFSWMYDKQGTAGLTLEQIDNVKKLISTLQNKFNRNDFKIFNEKNRIDLYSKPNDFDNCYFQKFVWSLAADCKIYPCCIMKYNPSFAYADLREKTLKEIIEDVNTKIKMDDLNPHGCFPCWLRTRNSSIAAAVEKPMHENFI